MVRNKPFIRKWIRMLLSGEFIQGQGQLKEILLPGSWDYDRHCELNETVVKHCCLGVALEQYNPNGWVKTKEGICCFKNKNIDSVLPERVRKFIGLTKAEQEVLTTMNDDDDGYSFEDIAAYLRNVILKTEPQPNKRSFKYLDLDLDEEW